MTSKGQPPALLIRAAKTLGPRAWVRLVLLGILLVLSAGFIFWFADLKRLELGPHGIVLSR